MQSTFSVMKSFDSYNGALRRMRLIYWLFNLLKIAQLLKNKKRYKELGISKAVWQSLAHADIKRHSADVPWLDAGTTTPAQIQQHPQFAAFAPAVQEQLLQWPANGFMVLPGLLAAEADTINHEVDTLQQAGKIKFNFTGRKIFNAWAQSEAVNNVFHHPVVLDIVRFIFQKEVVPFQTVNFLRGSEEKPHSDSIHMTTEPLGYLVAVWVALQDIQLGSGELVYYPGSHTLPYVMSEDFASGNTALQLGHDTRQQYEAKIEQVIQQNGFVPQPFVAKKGDVLIWHANLLHAGATVTNSALTRKSLVAHYFAADVLHYHEITQRPALLKPTAV